MWKTTQKTKHAILFCMAVLLLLTMAAGCSKSNTESAVSSEGSGATGSVSFSIQWPASVYTMSGAPSKASAEAISNIDCDKLDVVTIEVIITDAQGNSLGKGAWPCSAHRGTIANIPEGMDRKILVTAKDSVGIVVYQGEKAGIAVMAGQDNPIGAVEMTPALKASIDSPSGNQTILTGQMVKFSGSASGGTGTYAYQWTIEGGSPSTSPLQNPGDVTFSTAGSYTVTLTVTDSANHTSETAVTVNVNATPQLTASIASPLANQTITTGTKLNFKGSVSPGTGAYTYLWDFGGGATVANLTDKDPGDVTFNTVSPAAGFTVTFQVTNTETRKTSSTSVIITVNAPPVVYSPPTVTITSPADSVEVMAGDPITFHGQITPGSISSLSYRWTISGTNFSDTLSLDPSYTFDTIGTYTVTLTVSDGQNAPYASVTVRVREWSEPKLIENNDSKAMYPSIAFNDSGVAIVVWAQKDDTQISILTNRYSPISGWGTTRSIYTAYSLNDVQPQIACDSIGDATVVWSLDDGTRNNLWSIRYRFGGGWDNAQLIENDDSGGAYDPYLANNKAGNAIAVWSQNSGYGTAFNIWANSYNPSDGWGTAQLIETESGTAYYPRVAVDSSGNAIAVWYQSDGTHWNIWANSYTPIGGWGTAQLIETGDGGASGPEIAMDSSGNAIVIWSQDDGIENSIWANRYTPSSGWGTAQIIDNTNNKAYNHKIACDNSGNAIAVWREGDDKAHHAIWSNRYTPDGGWGKAQLMATNNVSYTMPPSISMDASGNAYVAWAQFDTNEKTIWSSRYTPRNGWEEVKLLEMYNSNDSMWHVAITCDDAGHAIAVWTHNNDIWASLFQ